MRLKNLTSLQWASLALALLLLLCLFPLPYGFYTVVRLAVAVIAFCWAYRFYNAGNVPLAITAIAVAILFQPLLKVILDRVTWNILDVLLAISLIILVFANNHPRVKS